MNMTPALVAQRRANSHAIAARKRAATHCKYGHEFTPGNVYYRKDGRRICKICKGDRQWYLRHGVRWNR